MLISQIHYFAWSQRSGRFKDDILLAMIGVFVVALQAYLVESAIVRLTCLG
jgi:hypothetical protein